MPKNLFLLINTKGRQDYIKDAQELRRHPIRNSAGDLEMKQAAAWMEQEPSPGYVFDSISFIIVSVLIDE